MTDFADEATERTEAQIAAALANRMPEGPRPTGRCHWCREPTPCDVLATYGEAMDFIYRQTTLTGSATYKQSSSGYEFWLPRRWCDAECRDMWEKRNA